MEGKNFKGAITIDMSESDSIAYESFKQNVLMLILKADIY